MDEVPILEYDEEIGVFGALEPNQGWYDLCENGYQIDSIVPGRCIRCKPELEVKERYGNPENVEIIEVGDVFDYPDWMGLDAYAIFVKTLTPTLQ